MSWDNLLMPCANNKGADQPAHLHNLIRAFVVRRLNGTIPLVSIPEISNLYLASVAAQTSLGLPWSQTPKTDSLVTRLIEFNGLRNQKQSSESATISRSKELVCSWFFNYFIIPVQYLSKLFILWDNCSVMQYLQTSQSVTVMILSFRTDMSG